MRALRTRRVIRAAGHRWGGVWSEDFGLQQTALVPLVAAPRRKEVWSCGLHDRTELRSSWCVINIRPVNPLLEGTWE